MMDENKKKLLMECADFAQLLEVEYGKEGSAERDAFERDAQTFCLAACLKEERMKAGLTQEELAARIGTKKSYISKLENGHADVQLSTLFRIFDGLGKKIILTIV